MQYSLYQQPRQRRLYRLWRGKNLVGVLIVGVVFTAASILIFHSLRTAKTPASQPRQVSQTSQASPTATPSPAPSSTPVSDRQALGIAAGSSLTSLSPAQLSARLDGIAASGASWIRFDFDWSLIQPNAKTSFTWVTFDNLVTAANARHLHILGILDYTPTWARSAACVESSKCMPANTTDFAAFAAATARRFAPLGVHNWEVWNEPNNPNFWLPVPSPSKYTSLLQNAYSALHTADKNVTVISAGLSPEPTDGTAFAPVDFLKGVYAAGGKNSFDAVGDHPYTFPLSPAATADDAWTQMAGTSNSLRSVMTSQGDAAKKIWITEYGAPTGGPGPIATVAQPNLANHPYVVDEGLQAKLLADAAQLYKNYSWAGPLMYYTYQDASTNQATNENFFGLLRADGSPKPAYTVFKQTAASLQ